MVLGKTIACGAEVQARAARANPCTRRGRAATCTRQRSHGRSRVPFTLPCEGRPAGPCARRRRRRLPWGRPGGRLFWGLRDGRRPRRGRGPGASCPCRRGGRGRRRSLRDRGPGRRSHPGRLHDPGRSRRVHRRGRSLRGHLPGRSHGPGGRRGPGRSGRRGRRRGQGRLHHGAPPVRQRPWTSSRRPP
ncbi:hypothetical protein ONE63_010244 [Megalurothrips usitatus]|uniref:Uncharacterized protein n=1 Tax=Megalurothrips usitatus TaxID=439358 RepID=A0AAV7XH73_9NEOP|nr:hypothetical protein ONE63_010244 [Megalurothrips usitatus]